jgi:hypothetical protein
VRKLILSAATKKGQELDATFAPFIWPAVIIMLNGVNTTDVFFAVNTRWQQTKSVK